MRLHTAHIAASAARHQCQRYLSAALRPEWAASLLPPGSPPLPTPQLLPPHFPAHPLLPALRSFREEAPHRWLIAPRSLTFGGERDDENSPSALQSPRHDATAWLAQSEPQPAYFIHGQLDYQWGPLTLRSDPLLLRNVTVEGRQHILIGHYTHQELSHQAKLELGLIAACIQRLLSKTPPPEGHRAPSASLRHTGQAVPHALQVDGCILPYNGTARQQKASLQACLRGVKNVDIKPYQEAMTRWLNALLQRGFFAHTSDESGHDRGPSRSDVMSWGPWCEETASDVTGCPLHRHCMVDLSARSDVALLPGVTPGVRAQLQRHGLHQQMQLANAKLLGAQSASRQTAAMLTPHPDRAESTKALIEADTPGPALDLLVQRARRMVRRHALKHRLKAPTARNSLSHTHGYRVPQMDRYPGMHRLFVDLQVAPETGMVYALSTALDPPLERAIKATLPEKTVVALTENYPPDLDEERRLWLGWCASLEALLRGPMAQGGMLHLFLTHRGLTQPFMSLWKRHKKVTASRFPAFAAWLQQDALYQQDMVTFVCDEAHRHINVPSSSTSLYAWALHAGYQWQWPEPVAAQLSAALVSARPPGGAPGWLYQGSCHWSHGLPGAARRFAIEVIQDKRATIAKETKLTALQRMLADRLAAMAWLARELPYVGMDGLMAETKRPLLRLYERPPDANAASAPDVTRETPHLLGDSPHQHLASWLHTEMKLARGLSLSQHHDGWAAPLHQKLYRGEALALRFDQTLSEGWKGSHCFRIASAGPITAPAALIQQRCRFVVGDVVVLCEAHEATQPWRLRRGWLGQIEGIVYPHNPAAVSPAIHQAATSSDTDGPTEALLQLKGLAWLGKGQPETAYAWRHRKGSFVHDKVYILSAASDAPRGQRHSKLFLAPNGYPEVIRRWMTPTTQQPPSNDSPHPTESLSVGGHLTPQQRRCVRLSQTQRCLMLVGPPGTGKTEVAMAALLQAMGDARADDVPCRAFVCARHPHSLQAALATLRRLHAAAEAGQAGASEHDGTSCDEPFFTALLSADVAGSLGLEPPGAITASAVEETTARDIASPEAFRPDLVNRSLYKTHHLILAGTPSDAYKIFQKRADMRFDMVVCDDGQDLSPEEGLMAMLSLDEDGRGLIAGDPVRSLRLPSEPWECSAPQAASAPLSPDLMTWLMSQRDETQQPTLQLHVEQLHQGFRLPPALTARLDGGPYWNHFPRPDPTAVGFARTPQRAHARHPSVQDIPPLRTWPEQLMASPSELLLLIHKERGSAQENDFERRLIEALLAQAVAHGYTAPGVVVGSRRQRDRCAALWHHNPEPELLTARLGGAGLVGVADDFVGQQRDVMIATATLSSPEALQEELRLMLHPQRQWLAWSRHTKKLVVIVSETLFELPFHTPEALKAMAPWLQMRAVARQYVGQWQRDDGMIDVWENEAELTGELWGRSTA